MSDKRIIIELDEDGSVTVEYAQGLDWREVAWMLRVLETDFSMTMIDKYKSGEVKHERKEIHLSGSSPTEPHDSGGGGELP